MTAGVDRARKRLGEVGQGHLVDHAATLDSERAARFLEQAAAWPWERLRAAVLEPVRAATTLLRPPVALTWKRQAGQGGLRPRLAKLGRGLLAGGRVATLLLAGGQGTRLGHDGPKGTFAFGPEPDRTLYRILAERVVAASRRAGRAVPFYVLTSAATDVATRQAFEAAPAWGLEDGQVRFVLQGELPAFDDRGRAIIEAPGRLALAPDGHGGALPALLRAGIVEELHEAGVDVLTTFQVDNPLGLPVDPVMLGWMVERRLQVVSKTVARAGPDERVGLVTRDVEGRHRIVEYSELPEEGVPDEVNQGSIAIHGFSVAFLRDLFASGYALPLHRAFKPVPVLGEDGQTHVPEAQSGYKLEQFIFDVFPEAKRFEAHEVKREREFAPVKNATGADSPATARLLVDTEVRRLYAAAGQPPPAPVSLRPLDLPDGK